MLNHRQRMILDEAAKYGGANISVPDQMAKAINEARSTMSFDEIVAEVKSSLKASFPKHTFSIKRGRATYTPTLTVTLVAGPTAFSYEPDGTPSKSVQINEYHPEFYKEGQKFVEKVLAIVKKRHWDDSDIQTDYFSTNFYLSIDQGAFGRPFVLTDASGKKPLDPTQQIRPSTAWQGKTTQLRMGGGKVITVAADNLTGYAKTFATEKTAQAFSDKHKLGGIVRGSRRNMNYVIVNAPRVESVDQDGKDAVVESIDITESINHWTDHTKVVRTFSWVHKETGRSVSSAGAVPWLTPAERQMWEQDYYFVFYDTTNGTTFGGRYNTEEKAQAALDKAKRDHQKEVAKYVTAPDIRKRIKQLENEIVGVGNQPSMAGGAGRIGRAKDEIKRLKDQLRQLGMSESSESLSVAESVGITRDQRIAKVKQNQDKIDRMKAYIEAKGLPLELQDTVGKRLLLSLTTYNQRLISDQWLKMGATAWINQEGLYVGREIDRMINLLKHHGIVIPHLESADQDGEMVSEYYRRSGFRSSSYSGDPRWITAKYAGVDAHGKPFKKGEEVLYFPNGKKFYTGAEADRAWREFLSAKGDEEGMPYAS
jgi:hypothetical protein